MLIRIVIILLSLSFHFTCLKAQIWEQIGDDIKGNSGISEFGYSVSMSEDGNIIAVGAPYNSDIDNYAGQVKVFQFINNIWEQIGDDINGLNPMEVYGFSVSLNGSGNVLAIATPYSDKAYFDAGIVKVYVNNSGTWEQIGQDLEGEEENDYFGYIVSLNSEGTVLAAGSIGGDGNQPGSGYVKVFRFNSGNWELIGQKIGGKYSGDTFGHTLDLSSDGNIIAIGAPRNPDNGLQSGHVQVFENSSDNWIQIGDDIQGRIWEETGRSLCLNSDGTVLAVHGLNNYGNEMGQGHVRLYKNNNGNWSKTGDFRGEDEDEFGRSVCFNEDGTMLAVSSPWNRDIGANAGKVTIYKHQNNTWYETGISLYGKKTHDFFGMSLDLSKDGSKLCVGSPGYVASVPWFGLVQIFKQIPVENLNTCGFGIFPNPSAGDITISLVSDIEFTDTDITFYDISGRTIMNKNMIQPIENLDLTNLSNGVYLLEINTEVCKSTTKLIINKY